MEQQKRVEWPRRRCVRCGIDGPKEIDDFIRRSLTADGFGGVCPTCKDQKARHEPPPITPGKFHYEAHHVWQFEDAPRPHPDNLLLVALGKRKPPTGVKGLRWLEIPIAIDYRHTLMARLKLVDRV